MTGRGRGIPGKPGKRSAAGRRIPLLEFDPDRTALIEPLRASGFNPKMPERVVMCFPNAVLQKYAQKKSLAVIGHLVCESTRYPVYLTRLGPVPVALAHPGIGAPLAAGLFEELIAMGGRKFVACGGCGVLDRELAVGHLLVASSAVRDEGTSYHYLPASREVKASRAAVAAIESRLKKDDLPYLLVKTWTTDGMFRETKARIRRRKAEGCLTVEMEGAALFAVAKFRKVDAGLILYAGDDVSGEIWDNRGWQDRHDVRERLLELAIRSVVEMGGS